LQVNFFKGNKKLTRKIFGEEEEAATGISYSQSGTYNPYNKERYKLTRTTTAPLTEFANKLRLLRQ
jgi:hypothetical protein